MMFCQNSNYHQSDYLEKWGIKLGNSQWALFKFLEKSSGWYIVPCFGNTGLHLSIHPSSQEYPYSHVHFKSDKLGIHEDVDLDDSLFSPEYWLDKVECLISLFELGCNVELDDNQVMVLPNLSHLIEETNNQHFFNLNSIFDGTFYMTEEKKIPLLIRKLTRNSIIGALDYFSVGITGNKQILFPFDKEHLFRFDYDKFLNTLFESNNSLFSSFEQAFNKVVWQLQSKISVYPHKFIPDNIMQEFERVKRRKPRFQLITY